MGVSVVFAKAGVAAIRGDCDSFRGGIAFQVDAGDASVCFDSAGLLADWQVCGTEGVAMALAGERQRVVKPVDAAAVEAQQQEEATRA